MRGNKAFYEEYPKLYDTMKVENLYTISLVTYVLAFATNIVIVGFYNVGNNNGVRTTKFYNDTSKLIVTVLSLITAAISFIMIMIWWLTRWNMRKNLSVIKYCKDNNVIDLSKTNMLEKLKVCIITPILDDRGINNFYFHLVFSILTVAYKPFFCSFQLILIVNIEKNTRYVYESITEHISKFVVTIFFVIFVIYTFSMVIAQYYYRDFNEDEVSFIINNILGW